MSRDSAAGGEWTAILSKPNASTELAPSDTLGFSASDASRRWLKTAAGALSPIEWEASPEMEGNSPGGDDSPAL